MCAAEHTFPVSHRGIADDVMHSSLNRSFLALTATLASRENSFIVIGHFAAVETALFYYE